MIDFKAAGLTLSLAFALYAQGGYSMWLIFFVAGLLYFMLAVGGNWLTWDGLLKRLKWENLPRSKLPSSKRMDTS